MPIVSIDQFGQGKVTIPRAILKAMKWEQGTVITWEVMGKDKLKIEKVK